MAGFTEAALSKKLSELNPSQQSIQTLSLWLIHHRKHHGPIVKVWYKELVKAKEARKLTFMYLANDVIQNSKKKGPEFGKEFGGMLKKAFEHMGSLHPDEKTKGGLNRLLKIWEERAVYDAKHIKDFRLGLANGPPSDTNENEVELELPPKKKLKVEPEVKVKNKVIKDATLIPTPAPAPVVHHIREKQERKKSETEVEVEVDGRKELHVTLSPRAPPGDPPEPEILVNALLELEKSASSDAAVRERIANLPSEVSQISLLSKLQDRADAEALSSRVSEAVALLTDYNSRLAVEMEERKKLRSMLQDFLYAQKELLLQAEERHEEYVEKLNKVYQVREELKSHLQNLPDLTQLPDVTGGLAPLPSAGDLFRMH